jgi:DNA-binding NarL/FixJ family response regulator
MTEEIESVLGRDNEEKELFELNYDIERLPMTDRQRQLVKGLLLGKEKQEVAKEMDLSGSAITWEVKALKENEEFRHYFGIG